MAEEFVPHILPETVRDLSAVAPKAPAGTLFALSAVLGWAVPLREYTLRFGRDEDEVHVPIGVGDPYISRRHGEFVCDGRRWSLRNTGQLPIRLLGESLLLRGQEMLLDDGYQPLFIGESRNRSHLLEVRIVGGAESGKSLTGSDQTIIPFLIKLSAVERLVLTALAQRYLRYEPSPQPVARKDIAAELNLLVGKEDWTPHRVSNVVLRVREQLSTGKPPVPGLMSHPDDPVIDSTLNKRLIQVLLETATLMPSDLWLLEGREPDEVDQDGPAS